MYCCVLKSKALNNATALVADLREHAPGSRFIFGFNEPDHSGRYDNLHREAIGGWFRPSLKGATKQLASDLLVQ